MNLAQLLARLKTDERFLRNVTRWERLHAQPGRYADFPPEIDPRLTAVVAGGAGQATARRNVDHANRVYARRERDGVVGLTIRKEEVG